MAFSKTSPGYFTNTSVIHPGSLTGAITVGTTAVPLRVREEDLSRRHTLIVHNNSVDPIYIGFDENVTIETGLPLPGDSQYVFEVDEVTIYAISTIDTDIRVAEVR